MTKQFTYKSLPELNRNQVNDAIAQDDIDTLLYATLSIATYDADWQYAQQLSLDLAHHAHPTIRANAILAIGYIARIHRKLEQHVVVPLLLNSLHDLKAEVREKATDAIEDVNLYMSWQIEY